jgi:thioredoxin-related protein
MARSWTKGNFASKYEVRGTPTVQFFPDLDNLGQKAPREREVNRIQGYLAPEDFLRMFAFVAERAYERGSLRDYLRRSPSLPSPARGGVGRGCGTLRESMCR